MKQYQPLYLKYRPQKLSGVIGQEVVTKTLSNAILYNKIVHAYLFCGPRGTGKTSTARILAKSLNCQSGLTLEPCENCISCKSIIQGNSLDVIEIDAASHRKVEDAEDLINRVNLATYGSRFKIYIIDEVHMLTDHAFNALLKTLEEPPKNVIFILATTEDYKVIPTIISRCQKLDFKPVSTDELEQKIKEIAHKEKINIDQAIINFISKRSCGCLRDAISLLDQISILQVDEKLVDPKEVFKLFGSVDRVTLFDLSESILSFEKKKAIDLAEELVRSGKDIGEFFKSLIELFIDLAKARIDEEYKKILSSELSNDLKVLDKIKKNHLLKIIERLQDAQSKLRFALSQELQFMIEVMSFLDEDFLISMTELNERIERLESGVIARKPEGLTKQSQESNNSDEIASSAHSVPPRNDSEKPTDNPDILWNKIIISIESNPTRTLLLQSGSHLLQLTNEIMEIGLSKDMFLPRLEKDTKKKELILKAAKQATGIEAASIRFCIQPKQKEQEVIIPQSFSINNQLNSNDDEFTSAIKNLLGAKEID